LVDAAKAKNPLAKIEKDARVGLVAGGGLSPLFMNKQPIKLWTSSYPAKDGSDVKVEKTYVQLTFEISKLFLEDTRTKKTEKDLQADIDLFRPGLLQDFMEQNPQLTVNKGAFRLNVARPFAGNRMPTWVDVANQIKHEDITKRSVTAAGILRTAAWKTSVMPARKRVVQSHFVNSFDVYAVVKQYESGAMKPLLDEDDLDAADAYDRKRKGGNLADADSDTDPGESSSSDDCAEPPPPKKPRSDKKVKGSKQPPLKLGGNASDLAD
jgi:hypothetical protein